MNSIWLYLLLYSLAVAQSPGDVRTSEVRATKGRFFVYHLYSVHFFNQTDPKRKSYYPDVKWSATMKGKPSLPPWLHLVPSQHRAIGYLIGTPVTPAKEVVIHIIARDEETFRTAEQFLTVSLNDDPLYNKSTSQITELYIKNQNAEEILTDRGGVLDRLEKAIKKSFKDNATYIYNIKPVVNVPSAKTKFMKDKPLGMIVQVGTQTNFHVMVKRLEKAVKKHSEHCGRDTAVQAYNLPFSPTFDIDWCKFQTKRLTAIRHESVQTRVHGEPETVAATPTTTVFSSPENTTRLLSSNDDDSYRITTRSRWDSFLMFPLLGVFCILFLLLLSLIFFGRREGQRWRDEKTPQDQLEEYVNVREGQRHLRDLSLHRQLLLPPADRAHSTTPLGIHSFLQPLHSNEKLAESEGETQQNVRSSKGKETVITAPEEHTSVGKQTVAEAAKAYGSSLHMYRNPFDDESNGEEEEEEESESTNGAEPVNAATH